MLKVTHSELRSRSCRGPEKFQLRPVRRALLPLHLVLQQARCRERPQPEAFHPEAEREHSGSVRPGSLASPDCQALRRLAEPRDFAQPEPSRLAAEAAVPVRDGSERRRRTRRV